MNAATLRKSNHIMKVFEHNINYLIEEIDRFNKRHKKKKESVLHEKYQGTDEDGNRSWGPF